MLFGNRVFNFVVFVTPIIPGYSDNLHIMYIICFPVFKQIVASILIDNCCGAVDLKIGVPQVAGI